MKKKIFKYKFVYWIVLLLNISISIAFLFGVYNRIETDYFDDFLDIFSFSTISLISIVSVICLVMLIFKNKNSVILFSTVLLLILLIITVFLFYSIFIKGDFGENTSDWYTVPILYILIFGILILIHNYKSIDNFTY